MFVRILCLAGFLVLLVLPGCKNKETAQSAPAIPPTVEDSISTLNIQVNNFIEIDSGMVMFQLSMDELEVKRKDYYKEMPASSYWNMLFYNSHTGLASILTPDKILIGHYVLSNATDYGETSNRELRYIFFEARKEDYNRDGFLTDEDPSYLFACDKHGKNFFQVSPQGYNLSTWKYLYTSDKVIMTVIADSDSDSLFNHKEEMLVFEKYMKSPDPAQPAFNTSFLDSLKLNFGRYWYRKR